MDGGGFDGRLHEGKLFFAVTFLIAPLSYVISPLSGRFGEFDGAKFSGIGKFADGFDTEVLEEEFSGGVKERSSGEFGAAIDLDPFPVEEFLQDAIRGHAAHVLDRGLGDGLAVGHDGEGFHRRRTQAAWLDTGKELADESAVFRTGEDLPASGTFDN